MTSATDVSPLTLLRLAAAAIATPIAAGVVMFISYLGLWYSGFRVFEGTPYDPLDSAVSIALGVSMIAFFATGAALRALVWMARRGPLSLGRVVALGAVLGNVPFVLIVASIFVVQLFRGTLSSDVARFWYGASGAVRAIALGLSIGPASAAVFWVVGIWGSEVQDVRRLSPPDGPGARSQ